MAAAIGIGRFVYTPVLPFMAEALALSEGQAGLIAAANFLGYMLGASAAATGVLKGSRRWWALAGLALSAVSTAAMALTVSVPLFLLLRFAGGAASAFVMVFVSALVFDHLETTRSRSLSHLHFAGVGIGIAISAVLVVSVSATGASWTGHWIAGGTLSVAALIAAWLLLPGTAQRGTPSRAPPSPIERRAIPLIAAYGLFGFGYVITATFISAMVRTTPAIATAEPYVWLAVGVAAIPSVALWVGVGQRIGSARSFALACLAESAGVALSVTVVDTLAILLSAVLLGGTFMGITALGLIMGRDMCRGDPRRMLALLTAAFGLGQVVGPAFAGFVSQTTGSFMAPSLTAAGALAIAAGLAVQVRPPPAASAPDRDRR